MHAQTVSTAVLIWVPIAAAAIGATAGLGGSLLVTRGTERRHKRRRLEEVYAQFLTAAHDAELFLQSVATRRTIPPLPANIDRALVHSLAAMTLVAPRDTHLAAARYGDPLRGADSEVDIREEIRANDATPGVHRWEQAIRLMRRDVDAPGARRRFRRP